MCDKNYLRDRHLNDISTLIRNQSPNSMDDFESSNLNAAGVWDLRKDCIKFLQSCVLELADLESNETNEMSNVTCFTTVASKIENYAKTALQKLRTFKPTRSKKNVIKKTEKISPKKERRTLKEMFQNDEDPVNKNAVEQPVQVPGNTISVEGGSSVKEEQEVENILDLFQDAYDADDVKNEEDPVTVGDNNAVKPVPIIPVPVETNNTTEDPKELSEKYKLEETESTFSSDTLIMPKPKDAIVIKDDQSSRASTCYLPDDSLDIPEVKEDPAFSFTKETEILQSELETLLDQQIKEDCASPASTCFEFPIDRPGTLQKNDSRNLEQTTNKCSSVDSETTIVDMPADVNDNHSVADSNATECLNEVNEDLEVGSDSSSDKTEIIDKDFPLSDHFDNDSINGGTSNDEESIDNVALTKSSDHIETDESQTILDYLLLKKNGDISNEENLPPIKSETDEIDDEDQRLLERITIESSTDSFLDEDDLSMDSVSSLDSIPERRRHKTVKVAKPKIQNISLDRIPVEVNPCVVRIPETERQLVDNFVPRLSDKRKRIYSSSDSLSSSDEGLSDDYGNLLVPMEDEELLLNGSDADNDENILNGIRETDDLSAYSSDEGSTESKKMEKRKTKQMKKKLKTLKDENGKWREDDLLRGKLVSDSDSDCEVVIKEEEDDYESLTKAQIAEIVRNCTHDIKEYTLTSSDESDSDVEFIDENSDMVGTQNSDSPTKKGRKNIREVLSSRELDITTIEAHREEKKRMDRLQAKQKKMEQYLSQNSQNIGTELILDASENEIIRVNPKLAARLKKHQLSGVRFMWDTCYETVTSLKKGNPGSGCILAHCMGLGKTFQVVTLIHTLFNYPVTKTKHVLVLCPLSTVLNWKNEFKIGLHLAGEEKTAKFQCFAVNNDSYKTKSQKQGLLNYWQRVGGVLIMGYETYRTLIASPEPTTKPDAAYAQALLALVKPGPDLIVCDEGHLLKNGKSARTIHLMKIATKRRIIMTGTPLQNNLDEYYHMVQFVKPNLLGTNKEYRNRFVNPIQNGQYENSTAADINIMKKRSHVLHSMLKGTVERYEASELLPYLPKKLDYVLLVMLNDVQKVLYKKGDDIIQSNKNVYQNKNQKNLFSYYQMLHSIWTHPILLHLKEKKSPKVSLIEDGVREDVNMPVSDFEPGWWKSLVPPDFTTNVDYGPKFKIMLAIIEECEVIGDKILIFSSSVAVLDAIEQYLKMHSSKWRHGTNYLRMDGSVSPDVRQRYCDYFNNPRTNQKYRFFLISHKVGGMGINLVAANRVILMDVAWNPSYDIQSIFRIYRFGQVKPCYVYRLVAKGTMEEVLYERSVTKQAIAGRVVDEQQISRHYKSEDLVSMYRCNLEYEITDTIPKLPSDDVLAKLLQSFHKNLIFNYHEHQALLENVPHEELQEDERQAAWDEYNNEKLIAEKLQQQQHQQYTVLHQPINNLSNQSILKPNLMPSQNYKPMGQNFTPMGHGAFATNRILQQPMTFQIMNPNQTEVQTHIQKNAELCETLNTIDLQAIFEARLRQNQQTIAPIQQNTVQNQHNTAQNQQNTVQNQQSTAQNQHNTSQNQNNTVQNQYMTNQNYDILLQQQNNTTSTLTKHTIQGMRRVLKSTMNYTNIPTPNAVIQRNNTLLSNRLGNNSNNQTAENITIGSLLQTNAVPSNTTNNNQGKHIHIVRPRDN